MYKKYEIQEEKYKFPYHYIPYFTSSNYGKNYRHLSWGMEYLCYIKHIINIILEINPKSVLDVGCGDGRMLGFLGDDIKKKVGVDLSKQAIKFAQAFHYSQDIEFFEIDAARLDGQFEVVLAIEVLEHIPDLEVASFINTLFQRTELGGYVIISVPSLISPVNKKHYRHYDLKMLESQIISSGVKFEAIDCSYVYNENWVINLFHKVTNNRMLFIDIKPLNKFIWRYIWSKLRIGNSKNGKHIIAVFRKI